MTASIDEDDDSRDASALDSVVGADDAGSVAADEMADADDVADSTDSLAAGATDGSLTLVTAGAGVPCDRTRVNRNTPTMSRPAATTTPQPTSLRVALFLVATVQVQPMSDDPLAHRGGC
jgi:hypothetical protein